MTFNWKAYCDLAHELVGHKRLGSEDAKMRSAISRAYYATFCSARNYLRDNEVGRHTSGSLRGTGAHQYVKDQFLNSTDLSRKKIGANLDRLRIDRNKADYDDTISDLRKLTLKSVNQASKILQIMDSL